MHEVAPGFGAALPGVGVGYGVDEGHDAVADEDHGGEVLCAGGGRDEHGGWRGCGGRGVVCWVRGGAGKIRGSFPFAALEGQDDGEGQATARATTTEEADSRRE